MSTARSFGQFQKPSLEIFYVFVFSLKKIQTLSFLTVTSVGGVGQGSGGLLTGGIWGSLGPYMYPSINMRSCSEFSLKQEVWMSLASEAEYLFIVRSVVA